MKDGVKVTIKASRVTSPGGILDFLTPDRQTAFRFNVDSENARVIRSSPAGDGQNESFGGWGLNVDGPISFEFTKTAFSWAVFINDARFPWFDFAHHDTGALMTHVSVPSSFDGAQVIVTRPACNTPCHPDECKTSQ